jgi:hypothetical protein
MDPDLENVMRLTLDVSCETGLSCLQHRLNELRSGFRIEVAPEGLY